MSHDVLELFYLSPVAEAEVDKNISNFRDSAAGWDELTLRIIVKKNSKCVGVILKARKKLNKSSLLNLYYSFAYPYFIYCNHVWGNTYPTNLK